MVLVKALVAVFEISGCLPLSTFFSTSLKRVSKSAERAMSGETITTARGGSKVLRGLLLDQNGLQWNGWQRNGSTAEFGEKSP